MYVFDYNDVKCNIIPFRPKLGKRTAGGKEPMPSLLLVKFRNRI